MLALGAYALAAPAREQYVLMSPEPTECQTKCIALMPPSVHGDPMFKMNGMAFKFDIPQTGTPTPLLNWTAPDGSAMELSGKTFTGTHGLSWFGRLVLSQDGKSVLDTQMAADGTR